MKAIRQGRAFFVLTAIGLMLTGCLGWTEATAFPELSTLTDVVCVDETHCWSVGDEGGVAAIVATSDGETWARQTTGVIGGALRGIACTTITSCVAVGSGTVLDTDDGGATWARRLTEAALDLRSVACVDGNRCVAVGGAGGSAAIRITTDGGTTWTTPATNGLPAGTINDIDCAANGYCLTAGPGHHMLFTDDGGTTWADRPGAQPAAGTTNTVQSISCLADGTCMAAGTNEGPRGFGFIWRTSTWGRAWSVQYHPAAALRAIDCVDLDHCWTGRPDGTESILATDTASLPNPVWNKQVSWVEGAQTANAIDCIDVNRCWVALSTENGPVLRSTQNGGANVPVISTVAPNAGDPAGGTRVTITGRALGDATEVLFGGTSATIVSKGLNELVVLTPPGEGRTLVDITVTTPNSRAKTTNVAEHRTNGPTVFVYTTPPDIIEWTKSCWTGPQDGCGSVDVSGTGFVPGYWEDDVSGPPSGTVFTFNGVLATYVYCTDATRCQVGVPDTRVRPGLLNSVVSFAAETVGGRDAVPFTIGPLIDSTEPYGGPASGGTEVTITGQSLGGITAVEFGGVPAASFRVVSPTEVRATTPPGELDTWVAISLTNSLGEWVLGSGRDAGFGFLYTGPPTITGITPTSAAQRGR